MTNRSTDASAVPAASRPAIPIANLYYLLAYAWQRLPEAELVEVAQLPETRLTDLFARVLASGVTHVLKRGLDRAYTAVEGEIAGIRGRLDLATSVSRASFVRGRAHCTFDELTPDVIHNRIVRTTLRRLANAGGLHRDNAERLRELYRRMDGVTEIPLSDRVFGRVMLGRNNAYYGFLLQVCELVYRQLLVDERSGRTTFRDFTRDDREMARLFEQFVANFLRHHSRGRPGWHVRAQQEMSWEASGAPDVLQHVPRMRTDVVLEGGGCTRIVETKYYAEALTARFNRESLRPAHLYQLFAYLSNHPASLAHEPRDALRGILLYPRTTVTLGLRLTLHGWPVEAWTLDLAQEWAAIEADLLRISGLHDASAVAERPS
jgi:5-methylcytosine-specific restriction enzyme subunit McrC